MGTRHRFGQDFLDAMEEAFDTLGGHDWLVEQGQKDPKTFMALLAKTIPRQQDTTVSHEIVDVAAAISAARSNMALVDQRESVPDDDVIDVTLEPVTQVSEKPQTLNSNRRTSRTFRARTS